MIRMTGDCSFGTHGQNDVRFDFAHAARQISHDRIKIQLVEAAIGIIEYLCLCYPEHFAGSKEFRAAEICQFLIGSCSAPVAGCLSLRHADHIRLNASRVIEKQCSAKCANFVIGMSRNA